MFCSKCGSQNPDGSGFCSQCGASLQQAANQQPQFQPQYNPSGQKQPGDGNATASLVCGIIGLFLFGLILGIIAIVQGNKAKSLGFKGGKATAGIVLGIIGLVGWAIYIIYLMMAW